MLGKIISLNAGVYDVYVDGQIIKAKPLGKFRNYKATANSKFKANFNNMSKKNETANIKLSPKVGDNVTILNDMIVDIEARHNSLIRPDVSNIDQVLLVFAAKEPTFSFYLLDLFLINIMRQDIKPIIVISKIDKCNQEELLTLKRDLAYYERVLNLKVIYINSKKDNPEEIVSLIPHKTTIVAGQTGSGKSTLINAIIPGFNLKTDEISMALGRGKHTTRITSLYIFNDGFLGDTPGFSKLDLHGITAKTLKDYYPEFREYKCKFNDCLHKDNSLGCAINSNPNILPSRYYNYLKMLKILEDEACK